MPAVLGEEPVRLPEDHWWIGSLANGWPTGFTGTHENSADIGVSLGLTTPGSSACLLGLQNATTGHG